MTCDVGGTILNTGDTYCDANNNLFECNYLGGMDYISPCPSGNGCASGQCMVNFTFSPPNGILYDGYTPIAWYVSSTLSTCVSAGNHTFEYSVSGYISQYVTYTFPDGGEVDLYFDLPPGCGTTGARECTGVNTYRICQSSGMWTEQMCNSGTECTGAGECTVTGCDAWGTCPQTATGGTCCYSNCTYTCDSYGNWTSADPCVSCGLCQNTEALLYITTTPSTGCTVYIKVGAAPEFAYANWISGNYVCVPINTTILARATNSTCTTGSATISGLFYYAGQTQAITLTCTGCGTTTHCDAWGTCPQTNINGTCCYSNCTYTCGSDGGWHAADPCVTCGIIPCTANQCVGTTGYKVCTGGVLSTTTTPCPTGQTCSGAGVCAVAGCTANQCVGTTGYKVCTGGVLSTTTTPCPTGQTCSGAGVCSGTTPCTVSKCVGTTAHQICTGGVLGASVPCPTGQTCSGAGVCAGTTGCNATNCLAPKQCVGGQCVTVDCSPACISPQVCDTTVTPHKCVDPADIPCEGMNRNGEFDPMCIMDPANKMLLYGAVGLVALLVLTKKK